jgi:hypothetical protein
MENSHRGSRCERSSFLVEEKLLPHTLKRSCQCYKICRYMMSKPKQYIKKDPHHHIDFGIIFDKCFVKVLWIDDADLE